MKNKRLGQIEFNIKDTSPYHVELGVVLKDTLGETWEETAAFMTPGDRFALESLSPVITVGWEPGYVKDSVQLFVYKGAYLLTADPDDLVLRSGDSLTLEFTGTF